VRARGRRTRVLDAEQKTALASAALLDKKAQQAVLLDLRGLTLIADFFLICSGTSSVHVKTLADAVRERLARESVKPYGLEGYAQGQWVLLDFGDLMVHVFAPEERDFYSLERLWADAPQQPIEAPARRRRRSGDREK
jgi:ribosome-associated protein